VPEVEIEIDRKDSGSLIDKIRVSGSDK